MKPLRYITTAILALFILAACQIAEPGTAEIIERGTFDCFEAGLESEPGKPVYCETSAVIYDGQHLIFASDKPIPGESAVFAFSYSEGGEHAGGPEEAGHGEESAEAEHGEESEAAEPAGHWTDTLDYLTEDVFVNAIKYEDFTLVPGGEYVIATTGFDRVQPDSNEWDGYNTLMFWPVEHPEAVEIVAPTTNGGITSSVGLRDGLSKALASTEFPAGVPYFKVEGLAAIPGDVLLFGIRELGARYDDFTYAIKIVSVSYEISGEHLTLGDDFTLIYDYDTAGPLAELDTQVALSSIEYDPYHDRLYLLTSFELEESDFGLGGYLWTLPLEDLRAGNPPTLVTRPDGRHLVFAHKAEAVTVLDAVRLLVAHDDDRVLGDEEIGDPTFEFYRQPNQAAYTIVQFTFN